MATTPGTTLSQLAKAARFVRDVKEVLPEVALVAEAASRALRDGAAVLEQSARVMRKWSSENAEKITVKRVP